MANAAPVHLYILPHPSLANRCEILDMAWIWPPAEKMEGSIGLGKEAISTSHSIHIFCFIFFIYIHFTVKFTPLLLDRRGRDILLIQSNSSTIYDTSENNFLQITVYVWNSIE